MHPAIKLAAALDLMATCLHKALGGLAPFLPLGGDHFTQLAVLIIVAVAAVEFHDVLRPMGRPLGMMMHPVEPLKVIRTGPG